MEDNLDKNLKQAQADLQEFKKKFEAAKEKNEQLVCNLEILKQKKKVLEETLQKQQKQLKRYEAQHQSVDEQLDEVIQKQAKLTLVQASRRNMIQMYRQKLSEDPAQPSTSASVIEPIASTSSAPDPQESCQILNAAVEENRLFLIELLQKIEDLSD